MINPFIIAKEVPKELAELVQREVESKHPLAKISLNKRKDDKWSVYCAGVNNFAINRDEIRILALRVQGDWEDSQLLAKEAMINAMKIKV